VQTLTDLQQYVRQHHTTGLVWAGKANTAASGIPPPPPPSMPIGDIAPMVNDDRSALFAQINQGEDITKSKYLYIVNELFFFLAFYEKYLIKLHNIRCLYCRFEEGYFRYANT